MRRDDWVTVRGVAPAAKGSGWSLTLGVRDQTFELVFVPSPHRMTVTFAPGTGRSEARWRTVPLGRPTLLALTAPDRDHAARS